MTQLQKTDGGEATSKRRRTRKSHWHKKWLVMTNGATLESRTIRQLMGGPKLVSNAMPRVIPKNLQRPRPAESEFGLKFVAPAKTPVNRRAEQRRTQDWDCNCAGPCLWERRVLARRGSQPKKRKVRASVGWDGLNHNGIVPVREFGKF